MTSSQGKSVLGELSDFRGELEAYYGLMNYPEEPSESLLRRRDRMRERLIWRINRLKSIIVELTGKQYINQAGETTDIWNDVVDPYPSLYRIEYPLQVCVQAIDETIVKMKAEGDIEQELLPGKEIRRNLNEPPWKLLPYFERATEDFEFQGHVFRTTEMETKQSGISKRLRVVCAAYNVEEAYTDEQGAEVQEITVGSWHNIGVIILRPLPDDRSLFIARFISSDFDGKGIYFNGYLTQLLAKFREWEVDRTSGNSLWRWTKSLFS